MFSEVEHQQITTLVGYGSSLGLWLRFVYACSIGFLAGSDSKSFGLLVSQSVSQSVGLSAGQSVSQPVSQLVSQSAS